MDRIGEKIEKYVKERIGKIAILVISIIISLLAYDGIKTDMCPEVVAVVHTMFVIFNIGAFVYLFKE